MTDIISTIQKEEIKKMLINEDHKKLLDILEINIKNNQFITEYCIIIHKHLEYLEYKSIELEKQNDIKGIIKLWLEKSSWCQLVSQILDLINNKGDYK